MYWRRVGLFALFVLLCFFVMLGLFGWFGFCVLFVRFGVDVFLFVLMVFRIVFFFLGGRFVCVLLLLVDFGCGGLFAVVS